VNIYSTLRTSKEKNDTNLAQRKSAQRRGIIKENNYGTHWKNGEKLFRKEMMGDTEYRKGSVK